MNLRDWGWCLIGCGIGLGVATMFYDFLMGKGTQNTPERLSEPVSGGVLDSHDKVPINDISEHSGGSQSVVAEPAVNRNPHTQLTEDIVQEVAKYSGNDTNYTKMFEQKMAEAEHPLDDDEEPESEEGDSGLGEHLEEYVERRPDEGPDEELTDSAFKNFPEEDKPRVITIDDMAEPYSGTTISLLYFEKDNTLIEEMSEEIVDDILRTVGNGLRHFGESDPSDPDYVAVRNEAFGAQYEITRIHDSYVNQILGGAL